MVLFYHLLNLPNIKVLGDVPLIINKLLILCVYL